MLTVVVAAAGCAACGTATDGDEAAADDTAESAGTSSDGELERDAVAELLVGAEVLRHRDRFSILVGRRVGVILNHASTVDGQSLLDVLVEAPDVEVIAAFGPEHGVRGAAAAGAPVADDVDPTTGVPVYSLYGDQRRPSAEMLAGVEVLVFDLQDVGARPYTYVSTMGLAMQAAAEAGITFVVLDRPNPLGGELVAGPVTETSFASFVGQYPIPLVHGLTPGELARAIKGEGWLDGVGSLDLQVVALEGWARGDRWSDTGRPWLAPSPSLPSPMAAAVYPGTVLFEATTLSVGRGTDEPFTIVGAPWVDGAALAARMNELGLAGVRFEAARSTPVPSASVPEPPYAGEEIGAVRIVPIDRSFRPVATGVHLLVEARSHAADQGAGEVVARPEWLDLLAGTDALRHGLERGASAGELIEAWRAEVAAFEELRRPYLLYE